MTPALYTLIEKNGFYFLVDGLEILPHTLEEVIARSIENNTFDINSSLFWYGIRESYVREIKRPYSLSELSRKPCLVEFTFIEEKYKRKPIYKWQISGLGINEPLKNSKGIITCLCAIFNKQIDVSHVKTITNFIINDEESIIELNKRLFVDGEIVANDSRTVYELVGKITKLSKEIQKDGKKQMVKKNEAESIFANFIMETITPTKNYLVFNDKPSENNIIYECKINHEFFTDEYSWLFDPELYKKRLQTELKSETPKRF